MWVLFRKLLTQFCQTAINKTAPVLPTPERQINAFDDTKALNKHIVSSKAPSVKR